MLEPICFMLVENASSFMTMTLLNKCFPSSVLLTKETTQVYD